MRLGRPSVEDREIGFGMFNRWVFSSAVVAILVLACGGDGQVVHFDSPKEPIGNQVSTSRGGSVSTSLSRDTGVGGSVGRLEVAPSLEVMSLRSIAVDRVNHRRVELGHSPLEIGDGVAAQYVAEQALASLRLADYTQEGLPLDAVYTAAGGRGSILSSGQIRGYLETTELQQCRSSLVICTRTDAEAYLAEYIDLRLTQTLPGDKDSLLFPDWETLHVGVAYTDYTFVVVLQLEHQKVTYTTEPSVSGGVLSLEVTPNDGFEIQSIELYHYPTPASITSSLSRYQMLSIHRPPDSGRLLTLPDGGIAADRWSSDGRTTSIAASIAERVPGPGVYGIVVWTDSDLPASEYFIDLDTTHLQKDPSRVGLDEPEVFTLQELRLFALELINQDRATHGVPPVQLGSNQAAQAHAEDSLRSGYLAGHWTSEGWKPYMLYTQTGGVGVIAENASGQSTGSEDCDQPTVVCGEIDVLSAIETLQWSMMYDDAHANWGHRDTIIDPAYDTVNIGIAFSDSHVAYYQHFEYTRLTHLVTPDLIDGILLLRLRPDTGFEIGQIAVYYDPPPTPKRPEQISALNAYCVGGGFTDECENVEQIARVLIPPPPGSHYVNLGPEDVVAHTWHLHADGSVTIEADLRQFITTSGVYTILVYSDSDPKLLAMYSISY